jgi:DNA invertase Pin-like site-specific DNA recombinase
VNAQRVVTYLRVSTTKQQISSLGLEAQRAAVLGYAASGGHSVVAEYVEVESGKRDNRPQLAAALASCRLHRATLVIAKLDRLARNLRFIAGIMDSRVDFVACDMPHANRLTLHLMAAMAEHEATAISERTKAALAAARARGIRLGSPAGASHLRANCRVAAAASAAARKATCVANAAGLAPLLQELHASGIFKARQLALELNRRGVPSMGGGIWYAQSVRRVLATLATAEAGACV